MLLTYSFAVNSLDIIIVNNLKKENKVFIMQNEPSVQAFMLRWGHIHVGHEGLHDLKTWQS